MYTSQAQRDIIFELRRIAFDAESDPSSVPGSGTEKRKAMYTKDYKMLGFTVSILGAPSYTGSQETFCQPWQLPNSHSGSPGGVDRGEDLYIQFALAMVTQWAYIIWACKTDPLVTGPGSQPPQRGGDHVPSGSSCGGLFSP